MAPSRRRDRQQSGIDDDDDADGDVELTQSSSTERGSQPAEVNNSLPERDSSLILQARPEKRQRTGVNSEVAAEDVEIDDGIEYGDDDVDEDVEDEEMMVAATQRTQQQAEIREEREKERATGVNPFTH
jgi:hypothetical protein